MNENKTPKLRELKAIRLIAMDRAPQVGGESIEDIFEVELKKRKNGDLTSRTAFLLEAAISRLEEGKYVFFTGVDR